MKRLTYLPVLFSLLLLLGACGESGDDPTPDAATFRVELQQSGDYEKFIKIIVISGGEFKETGTNNNMPTVLYDDELRQANLSFEAEGVRELKIGSTIGFSPVEDTPASMALKIIVSKNGKVIDQQTHLYTHEDDQVNVELSYKAGE